MSEQRTLNRFYDEFEAGLYDERELEAKIFKHILDEPYHFGLEHFRDRNECGDFLGWIYPRLSACIKKYVRDTATFETYINATLRFSTKEYLVKQYNFYESETNAWDEKSHDLFVEENEMKYGLPIKIEEEKEPENDNEKFNNARNLLILLLKSYYFLSPDIISDVASSTGLQEDEIYNMISQLRQMRRKSEARVNMLREYTYTQYFRYISNEKRLRSIDEESPRYNDIKKRIRMQRERFHRTRKRLGRVKCGASNLQVAQVMGLPKSTVDSAIRLVRRSMEEAS